jgi:hypothetical protein
MNKSSTRRHTRRQFRHSKRHALAALRAYTGANLHLGHRPTMWMSQTVAASYVGSTGSYVNAMVAVIQSEDEALLGDVLRGKITVLKAAKIVRKRAGLVQAYRVADATDRAAFGKAAGVDAVWDEVLIPNLS